MKWPRATLRWNSFGAKLRSAAVIFSPAIYGPCFHPKHITAYSKANTKNTTFLDRKRVFFLYINTHTCALRCSSNAFSSLTKACSDPSLGSLLFTNVTNEPNIFDPLKIHKKKSPKIFRNKGNFTNSSQENRNNPIGHINKS